MSTGAGATVTFLLRSPTVFDTDEEIQRYVKNGHAVLVKGDALVSADVQKAWDTASKDRPVDFLLFSVGELFQIGILDRQTSSMTTR
jgi:hypothetical protein